MTSMDNGGEVVSKHDTGVVQINLSQDEVMSIIVVVYP